MILKCFYADENDAAEKGKMMMQKSISGFLKSKVEIVCF